MNVTTSTVRTPLSRQRVFAAAMRLVDAEGLSVLTMRRLAADLGVEAMSLYHHVESKDALIDALADWAMAKILLPVPGSPWREAMADRAHSAREVLREHTWALGLLESRPVPGPALLRHNDRVTGCLLEAGFSSPATTSARQTLSTWQSREQDAPGKQLKARTLRASCLAGRRQSSAASALSTLAA